MNRITRIYHLNEFELTHVGQRQGSTTENHDTTSVWQRAHWTGQDPIISD